MLEQLLNRNCSHILNNIIDNLSIDQAKQLAQVDNKFASLVEFYNDYDPRSITKKPIFIDLPDSKSNVFDPVLCEKASTDHIDAIIYRKPVSTSVDLNKISPDCLEISMDEFSGFPVVQLNYLYWLNFQTKFKFRIGNLLKIQLDLLNNEENYLQKRYLCFKTRYHVFYQKNNSWTGDHTPEFKLGLKCIIDGDETFFSREIEKVIFDKSDKKRKMVQGVWHFFQEQDLIMKIDLEFLRQNVDKEIEFTTVYSDTDGKTSKDNIKFSFVDLMVNSC